MLCNLQTPFIQFARTLKNFTSHPTARMILCTIFALFTFKTTHFLYQTLYPGDFFEKNLEECLPKSIKIATYQTD